MTSLRARILEIQGTPVGLDSFSPTDAADFSLPLAVRVGPTTSGGGDFFYVTVCTPVWLARRAREIGPLWGRTLLIVDSWDRASIERKLEEWCASAVAESWQSLAMLLGRDADWEYAPTPKLPAK